MSHLLDHKGELVKEQDFQCVGAHVGTDRYMGTKYKHSTYNTLTPKVEFEQTREPWSHTPVAVATPRVRSP